MVYVMVENENIGLSAALTLLDRMKSFPVKILVQMNEEKGLANLIRESDRSTAGFLRNSCVCMVCWSALQAGPDLQLEP